MAAHVQGVWGIDLGQCALKAIRVENLDGQVVATAFDYIEHPKILSQPDADPDQLTREALEQFLSRNSLRGDMVIISVPGQSGLARFVKLPPVEEKKIADIVKFEAKQQIPFPLDEVVWDFQKLSSGSLSGDFVETEIGLFAMKREMVNRALQQFKEVNVEVHVIQMAPLALCNFIAYDQLGKTPGPNGEFPEEETAGKKQCVVALDMGTDSSNLVITDAGRIIWQRPIPIGGNHFTRALTKDLKLTFAKAEHLKRNAAKSPDLRKILASLKSVLNDFVGEVQRSLGYFTNTHRDAQIQYMVGMGNAFRLPGLKQFLQEKLQLEVRKLGKFERLAGDAVTAAPTFSDNIMGFGVPYGLALQGLKQGRLHTNLLPHEVRIERMVRGKKPWAAAAAACLLVAVAGLAMAKGFENGHVTGDDIKRSEKEVKGAIAAVKAANDAYEAEVARIAQSKQNLTRLAAGTPERLNWQLLHEYINYALPLPNGERLADPANDGTRVKERFKTQDADRAFLMSEARRFPDPKKIPDKLKAHKEDQLIKQHLIQINIEGIMELYSDDLSGYFRKIYKDTDLLLGMDQKEKNNLKDFVTAKDAEARSKLDLPKSGWVIEIRGYTYHKEEMKFVTYTLVENLRKPDYVRKGLLKKDPTDDAGKQIKEMDETVHKNIGYIFVYKKETLQNPDAGSFKIIGQSLLRALVKGEGDGGGKGDGSKNMGLGSPNAGDSDKKDESGAAAATKREGWSPVGEVSAAVLGGGGGFGGGGAVGGGMNVGGGKQGGLSKGGAAESNTKDTTLQPRTEFIVLLVWREPQPSAPPSAAAVEENKK